MSTQCIYFSSFYFALVNTTNNGSNSMSWPRRGGQRNRIVSGQIHKSASFTQSAIEATNFGQDFTGDCVEEARKSTGKVSCNVPSVQPDLHFGQRRQLGKGDDREESNDDPIEGDGLEKLENQLEKVLRINKRGYHRKSTVEVSSNVVSIQKGVHFGQRRQLGKGDKDEKGIGDSVLNYEVATATARAPSTALEGILNILCGAFLNMPDSAVEQACGGSRSGQSLLPEYILTLVNHPDAHATLAGVRLLVKYVQRTWRSHPDGYRMDEIQGYHLLACQLFSGGCSSDVPPDVLDHIACSLLSLVHGVEVGTITNLPELPSRQARIRSSALPPLLSLLPAMAAAGSQHLATLHTLIVHLHDITARVQNFLRTEYERLGLFEVLCKTLQSLLTSSEELWQTDISGQDGRSIIKEDLDFLFRFVGLQSVSAYGAHGFRILEILLNMLLHMGNFNPDIGNEFRQLALNVLNDAIAELLERIQKVDTPQTKSPLSPDFAKQFASNGNANIVVGEEVKEYLLMRSIVDDQLQRAARLPAAAPSSSECSFSFKGDALKAHSSLSSEATKQANRSDLLFRLEHLVQMATEICLYAPNSELPKDFIVSLMVLLMAQLQESRPLLSRSYCQSKLMALSLRHLDPSVPLVDKLHMMTALHSRQPSWSRLFQQHVVYYSAEDQVLLHRLFVATFSTKYRRRCRRGSGSGGSSSSGSSSSSGEDDEEEMEADGKLPLLMEALPLPLAGEEEKSSILPLEEELKLVKKYQSQWHSSRLSFIRRNEMFMARVFRNHEEKINSITTMAINATASTMSAQNALRKEHLNSLRDEMAMEVIAQQKLKHIVSRFTHEKGPFSPISQQILTSWQLDEIEGDARMRKRLRRVNRTLDPKFYMEPMPSTYPGRPFSTLLKQKTMASDLAGILLSQLSQHESTSVKVMEQCWLVIPQGEVPGEVLLTSTSLHFVQQGDVDPAPLYVDENLFPLTLSMSLESLNEVLPRFYQLNDLALELFFEEAKTTRFLAFSSTKSRNVFLQNVSSINARWLSDESARQRKLQLKQKQWQEGEMSNFEYLMFLNKMSGRTFNDLMQYPIFPFVLADYTSLQLCLDKHSSYRDLGKPVSIQQHQREEHYRENYRILAEELQDSLRTTCPGVGPYHYGSHYSNTGIVLHYMARLPPFTAMFLKYQDGSFDIPDRSFHDLEATWSSLANSSTDVKELIPELFYLPELLENNEKYKLGTLQNGQTVNDVRLPPWANKDARFFVKIHSQALESDYVSANLHLWIDLIFGYKQQGPDSVDAVNVFHPATYYGFDLNSIKDPVQRQARRQMIRTYGQTPKQLFERPHPMKKAGMNPHQPDLFAELDSVQGAKWAKVAGIGSTSITFADYGRQRVSLWTSSSGDRMFGLQPGTACLVDFTKSSDGKESDLSAAASEAVILSLDPIDGWLWLKRGETARRPLLPLEQPSDCVTSIASVSGTTTLYVGYASGKLKAFCFNLHPSDPKSLHQLNLEGVQSAFGHRSAINDIAVSRVWGIVVTASNDGSSIVWDAAAAARQLTYVRAIEWETSKHHRLVKVGRSSGDIMIATTNSMALFTINGTLVASQETVEPDITSLDISSQSVGINVVATGHAKTGIVKLWSTLDLSPLRDIPTHHPSASIVSLAFSFDSQYLYASFKDKFLVILERSTQPNSTSRRPPNYIDMSQMD